MYVIYTLIDPRDHTVHYVGMTDNVYKRFLAHINCSGNNLEKNLWIQELRRANVLVLLKTLETTEDVGYARIREAYWIQHFVSLHEPLTNRTLKEPPRLKMQVIVRSQTKKRTTYAAVSTNSEQKQFTPAQEADFVHRYRETGSIKESIAQMHLSYGRYQRHASEIVQARRLKKEG